MNAQAPRIAIPEPTSTDEAYNQRSLPQYVRAVEAAGGVPVPIPLRESNETQARLLATCSAILLPGSPADVDPARYGQQAIKECAAKDAPREAVDELLFKDAFATGKPILGICYGLQSLNVWRHGTLHPGSAAPGARQWEPCEPSTRPRSAEGPCGRARRGFAPLEGTGPAPARSRRSVCELKPSPGD